MGGTHILHLSFRRIISCIELAESIDGHVPQWRLEGQEQVMPRGSVASSLYIWPVIEVAVSDLHKQHIHVSSPQRGVISLRANLFAVGPCRDATLAVPSCTLTVRLHQALKWTMSYSLSA